MFNCEVSAYTLSIYNRWGAEVFHSNESNAIWDASFNNQMVPEGMYLYRVDFRFEESTIQTKTGALFVVY